MRKLAAVTLLAVSSTHAHAVPRSEKPVRQAVHAERRVVHKAKDTAPADYPSTPASQAMKLPYDAFRA
jgi:hypothetical protein